MPRSSQSLLASGATSNPPSGTLRDFTTPQVYSVTSADGNSTRNVTVTVYHYQELRYTFDNGTLQDWQNRVWDLSANAGAGGWINLAPNATTLPNSVNGGVIQPPSGDNGLFVPGNGAVWVSGGTDSHLNTLWLRSPEFYLSAAADLTVQLSRGVAIDPDPSSESEISHLASETGGWKGVALRRASDGAFLLTKPRTGASGDQWRTVTFTAAELATFDLVVWMNRGRTGSLTGGCGWMNRGRTGSLTGGCG